MPDLPDLHIVRWPFAAAQGDPSVTFAVAHVWELNVTILKDQKVLWCFHEYEPEVIIRGNGIDWANGRLTKAAGGTGAVDFHEIITRLGVTFGQIEGELRDMTGYREPIGPPS